MKLVSWNPLSSDSFIVTNQKELHVYSFLKEEHKQNKEWNQEIHKMDFDETITVKKILKIKTNSEYKLVTKIRFK
jgi:hypothetical protein